MNNEIIFQNPDQNLDNPFEQKAPSSKKITLPSDKRILALMALGVAIIFLIIVAAIVSATRKQPKIIVESTPTSAPTQIITPSPIAVPTEFLENINKINQTLHFSPEINPPKIDDTIGL